MDALKGPRRLLGPDVVLEVARWHVRAQLAQFGALFWGVFGTVTGVWGWHLAARGALCALGAAVLGAGVRAHAAAGALKAAARAFEGCVPGPLAPLPRPGVVTPTLRAPLAPPGP